jgi:threonine/homoserine/homoserine lactone efflux protein
MVDPSVLPGFLIAVIAITAAPGPDNAYIAAVAVSHGARAGLLSALGMAIGMAVHVCAAAVGLAILLRSAPPALDVIRVAGAAYLGYLAVTTLHTSLGRPGSVHRATLPETRLLLRRAALTNLTNPKVILFFAAFLPQFVRPGYGPTAGQLATLGLLFLVVGWIIDSVVGLVAGRLGDRLGARTRAARSAGIVAGITFGVLAGLLLLDVLRGA